MFDKLDFLPHFDSKKYLMKHFIDQDILEHLDKIPKTLGSFGHDPWGYSKDGLAFGLSMFRRLYEDYFRTEVIGIHNVPQHGRVLIVANHSGQFLLMGCLLVMLYS